MKSQYLTKIGQILGSGVAVSFLLLAALMLCEGFYGGFVNPTPYRFGADSMVSIGGWAYESRYHYFTACLLEFLPVAVGSILLLLGCFRKRVLLALVGASLVVVPLVVASIAGRI